MKTRLLLALLLAPALACEQTATPPPSRQWTMFDLDAAFRINLDLPQERKLNVLVGAEAVPAGLPPEFFVRAAGPVVPISAAYTEGGFSPYITTNVWANTPEVWVQPMYILVDKWDPKLQKGTPIADSSWVFTVGPQSRFHSPFWRVYFAEAPPNTQKDTYKSSAQIFRDKLVLHEGPGRLISLVPSTTTIEPIDAIRPWLAGVTPLQPSVRKIDYLDGAQIGAIDFGVNRFEWNDALEVVEQPFFVLVTCTPEKGCGPSMAPNVGGTGPLFARRPAMVPPGGKPRFGSFWRLYKVTLPSDHKTSLFIPPAFEKHRAAIEDTVSGLDLLPLKFTPDPMNADLMTLMNKHFLQVALNAAECFETEAAFARCQWLDSQKAIEDLLPAAITRTGITVTCPFVGYDLAVVPK
jgi:hypothetical protein